MAMKKWHREKKAAAVSIGVNVKNRIVRGNSSGGVNDACNGALDVPRVASK